MSLGVIAVLTALAFSIQLAWLRLIREPFWTAVGWSLLIAVAIPYGVATLLWLVAGGVA